MPSGILSPWHIAIFVLVVLLVFGPKRLPEMGRSLGKGMREFKDSISGAQAEDADKRAQLTAAEEDAFVSRTRGHDTAG